MSMYLKFRIGKDKRKLVPINGFELNDADSNNPQWIQGRQNEDGGRQVFVDLEDEDGSPVNLTGANAIFKGVLPGGEYKIWDHKHSTIIDAQAGRFRYTFPKRAMAIAGSYKQAFFEIYREGNKLATLEFNFEVLADLVEENIIPSDYITPFEDLYGKLKEYLVKFNGDFETAMAQWKKDVADLITELNADVSGINLTITEIKTQLSALEDKIKADGLLTKAEFDTAVVDLKQYIIDQLSIVNTPFRYSEKNDIGGDAKSDYLPD
ncbi:phage baseplate upper protein, partial [Pediococcus acidilactici]